MTRRAGRSLSRIHPAMAIAALALAVMPATPSLAASPAPDPIVGAWQATLDANGDTVPASIVFTSDGTVLVTSPEGLDGAAAGAWVRVGDVYHITVIAHAQGTDGAMVLQQAGRIGEDGTLSAEGSATLTPDGGTPDTRAFSATATRIVVDLPAGADGPAAEVSRASGAGPDAIASAVAAFTAPFGKDNAGAPGPFTDGYRRVTWDKVPADQSAPDTYAPDFFNGTADPRARGILFGGTAGDLMVSAGKDAGKGALRFGTVNSSYPSTFQANSLEKLFSPLGTNELSVSFFQPGTTTPAATAGFSAVFADVDAPGATTIEAFRTDGTSLGVFPADAADGGLSFLGVRYEEPIIASVRITLGTSPLGPTDSADVDVVVLDDLHYAEPQPLP